MPVWFKRFFLISFLLFLVSVSFVLAVSPFLESTAATPFSEGLVIIKPLFNYHATYTYIELPLHIHNISTGLGLTNATVSCDAHLYNETGEEIVVIENVETHSGYPEEFVLKVQDPSIMKAGYYGFSVHCNTSSVGGYASGTFEATATGREVLPTTQDSEDELFLYFVFAISILLLTIAFVKQDHNLASISGMLQIILGGYIIVTGFSTITNNLSNAIGIILIAVGFYVLIRSNIENF